MDKKIEVVTNITKDNYIYCDYCIENGFLVIKREQEIEINGFTYNKFYQYYNLQNIISFGVIIIDK